MIFLRSYKNYIKCYNILCEEMSLDHKIVINDVAMAKIIPSLYNVGARLVTKYIYEDYNEWNLYNGEWQHYNVYRFHIKKSNICKEIITTLKFKINEVSQYHGRQYTDDHLVLHNGTTNIAIRSINIDITHKRLKNFIKMICKKKYTTSFPLTRLYVNGKFRNTLWARLGF